MDNILSFIFLLIIFLIVTNAGLLFRSVILNHQYTKKAFIIFNIIGIIIVVFLYFFKYNNNCKIDLLIENKAVNAEIILDKEHIYNLNKNDKLKIDDVDKKSSFIAVKTTNKAKLVFFGHTNDHPFSFSHIIKIEISDNNIKIKSFLVTIITITDDANKFDDIINAKRK